MKKILSILLCVVMMLALLAGCGGSDEGGNEGTTAAHKHTYATEWSADETNHWYAATCEHTTLQANFGEHVDENLDGICDICAYASICASTNSTEHSYYSAWSSDETSHWHAASCNHIGSISDKAAHVDEDNDGACDVCAYNGGHNHTFAEAWNKDETNHWHESDCGHDVIDSQEAHVDITNDGECDVCGWFDPDHTHTYADTYTCDVTYHWFGATCEHSGAYTGREQHADNDENGYCDICNYLVCQHIDFDVDGECDICGGPLDPNHVHEYGTEMGSNTTSHWYISTCHPGASSEAESHVDKNNDGQCDTCLFQVCGHSFDIMWSNDETHHWHAIMCSCSIARKDYGVHVDEDNDGGCDICLYGLPVPSVYEVIVDHEPFFFVHTGMLCYQPFTVYFPQPGRYVITPDNENFDVVSPTGANNNAYYLTLDVAEAGEMELQFRGFDFEWYEGKETFFTYTVIRMDDLVLNTMQGKVELPSNTIYTIKFNAPEVGTYKLISGVDGLVIGLTEDSMEYFKGHIEMNVEYVGQEFTLYVFYESISQLSFTFDWQLQEPFCLNVGEGNYAVDVGPTQIDYKVEFTAPADGYYLFKLHNQWLTFAEMRDVYDVPVRMETMETLTPYMTAGETFTIWIQTVYNYPEALNCFDTLSITNVGENMSAAGGVATPGAAGSHYHIQASKTAYYRFEISGGELGIIANNGAVTWTSNMYDVNLTAGQTYTFMLRGEGEVSVTITTMTFETTLYNGDNTITMEPNKLYNIIWMYNNYDEDGNLLETIEMDENSCIALNWEGNLSVYVDGEEYQRGATIELSKSVVQILVKSNGAAEVKINVTMVYDAHNDVPGVTYADLVLNQYAVMAVNKDGNGTGATANFVAEVGATYNLSVEGENSILYVMDAMGNKTQVLTGSGNYEFHLEGGEDITFFFLTSDESVSAVNIVLKYAE